MKLTNVLASSALALGLGVTCNAALALDKIDADDFVEEASASGIAEIETSKLALTKTQSPQIREFAQEMINDHTEANKALAAIAQRKKLEVSTEAQLMNKAKASILQQRDGQSFNDAYIENQLAAHEKTIHLFIQAAVSDDAELAAFAKATLPKLEHHLHKVLDLVSINSNSDKGGSNNNAKDNNIQKAK